MSSTPKTGHVPPWHYQFREGVSCLFCGGSERVALCPQDGHVGVCEPCSVTARWVWKTLLGDAVPVDKPSVVGRVKVVVARVLKMSDGGLARPDHPASYEFLVQLQGGEGEKVDLPSADRFEGEPEVDAVLRALGDLGVTTWKSCVEPLYTAHTMRGGLARVYLATVFADNRDPSSVLPYTWRPWPLTDHVDESQLGFYAALGEVWPLRLYKHRAVEPRTTEVVTRLRKGAVEYVRTQLALLQNPDADTSMIEYLLKSMTDDERLACKSIVREERKDKEKKEDEAQAAAELATPSGEYDAEAAADEGPSEEDLPAGDDGGDLESALKEGADGE